MVAIPQPVLDATICVAKTDCCAASAVLAAAVSLRIARALGFAFLVLATDAEDPGTATADEALSQLVLNGNRRAFESATWPLVCDALKPPAEELGDPASCAAPLVIATDSFAGECARPGFCAANAALAMESKAAFEALATLLAPPATLPTFFFFPKSGIRLTRFR